MLSILKDTAQCSREHKTIKKKFLFKKVLCPTETFIIKQNMKYEKVIFLEFKAYTWFQLLNNKHFKITYGEI